MKNLKDKIQQMLDGEQKRRAIALRFLDELTEELREVSTAMYGDAGLNCGEFGESAVSLWKEAEKKKTFTGIYYRYETYSSETSSEEPGFYYDERDLNIWGTPLSDIKGSNFWWAIRVTMEWLPLYATEMGKKGISRDKLTQKIDAFLTIS